MTLVQDTITSLRVGSPTSHLNLTVFPLFAEASREPDYLTLDAALSKGGAHVTEVSEGGSVPELKFVNESGSRILLMDGEELVGAKQNRVLNISILVPAGKTLVIPVSCVERGRWSRGSGKFSSAARAQYSAGRAKRVAQVTSSLKEAGTRRSDQGAVWADIDAKFSSLGSHSGTSAMSDIYEQQAARLENYVRSLVPAEGQVGAVFSIGGEVVGLDLFDSASTLRNLYPKLLRSYALDALERSLRPEAPSEPPNAPDFLETVLGAEVSAFPATGEGVDLRLTGPGVTGAALAVDERIVHLNAFPNRAT